MPRSVRPPRDAARPRLAPSDGGEREESSAPDDEPHHGLRLVPTNAPEPPRVSDEMRELMQRIRRPASKPSRKKSPPGDDLPPAA